MGNKSEDVMEDRPSSYIIETNKILQNKIKTYIMLYEELFKY